MRADEAFAALLAASESPSLSRPSHPFGLGGSLSRPSDGMSFSDLMASGSGSLPVAATTLPAGLGAAPAFGGGGGFGRGGPSFEDPFAFAPPSPGSRHIMDMEHALRAESTARRPRDDRDRDSGPFGSARAPPFGGPSHYEPAARTLRGFEAKPFPSFDGGEHAPFPRSDTLDFDDLGSLTATPAAPAASLFGGPGGASSLTAPPSSSSLPTFPASTGWGMPAAKAAPYGGLPGFPTSTPGGVGGGVAPPGAYKFSGGYVPSGGPGAVPVPVSSSTAPSSSSSSSKSKKRPSHRALASSDSGSLLLECGRSTRNRRWVGLHVTSASALSGGAGGAKLATLLRSRRDPCLPGIVLPFEYEAPPGEWVHLAFVATRNEVTLFVNGGKVGAHPVRMQLPMNALGCRRAGLKGDLQEVRRVLCACMGGLVFGRSFAGDIVAVVVVVIAPVVVVVALVVDCLFVCSRRRRRRRCRRCCVL